MGSGLVATPDTIILNRVLGLLETTHRDPSEFLDRLNLLAVAKGLLDGRNLLGNPDQILVNVAVQLLTQAVQIDGVDDSATLREEFAVHVDSKRED